MKYGTLRAIDELEAAQARIKGLPPAERLLLAYELMCEGHAELAMRVADDLVAEWQAAKIVARRNGGR